MPSRNEVPTWLLQQLFVNSGVFNEDRTAVISRSDAPDAFSIELTKRPDWEAIKERLANEGF